MARKLSTVYPGLVIIDANNPNGTFKPETIPTVSNDGTPLKEEWQQDHRGFLDHLLAKAGLTHDGVQESEAGASQYYEALEIVRNFINLGAISGFTFKSNTGTPDILIDQLDNGVAVCEDGKTTVSDTIEVGINIQTLFGGALAINSTYHLFSYKKNDDTIQRYVSTSLAPTISDIKSALAYRRVFSVVTDGSGDILPVYSYNENGALYVRFQGVALELIATTIPPITFTLLALPIPVGLKLKTNLTGYTDSTENSNGILIVGEIDSLVEVQLVGGGVTSAPGLDTVSYIMSGRTELYSNTAATIQYRRTGAFSNFSILLNGYTDFRRQFLG